MLIPQKSIVNFHSKYTPKDLPGKSIKPMKVKAVRKSVKNKSKLKSTKTKSANPTHRRKPRPTTTTFKTTERSRMYSRAYRAKIAQLKPVDGYTAEEAKELARAHAKAVLLQNGFSVRAMVPADLFSETQIRHHNDFLRVVAEAPIAFDSLPPYTSQQKPLTTRNPHPTRRCRSPKTDVLKELPSSARVAVPPTTSTVTLPTPSGIRRMQHRSPFEMQYGGREMNPCDTTDGEV